MVIQYEEFLARIIHNILTKVIDQKSDIGRLVPLVSCRKAQRMVSLVCKEHFQAASVVGSVSQILELT
jgi:hypothetical protein